MGWLQLVLVVGAVAISLVVGSVIGVAFRIRDSVLGFAVAVSAGALITALVLDLMEPAVRDAGLEWSVLWLLVGAAVFVVVDRVIESTSDTEGGLGMLAAVTLDGLPENLALGVTLIGATFLDVSALVVAIVLANLPEAAGGSTNMKGGRSGQTVIGFWAGVALLLTAATVIGFLALRGASDVTIGVIRAIAAGAVISSLATEVFPQAYAEASKSAGIATTIGFGITIVLDHLAG